MRYPLPTYNRRYTMDALFPAVDVTTSADALARPGQRTLIPDFLSQSFVNLLDGIRFWSVATYTGQQYTTMCYQQQGTQSLWLLNLAFNGLSHPCQLQPGMQLRFPAISEVQRLLALQSATSGVGKIATL